LEGLRYRVALSMDGGEGPAHRLDRQDAQNASRGRQARRPDSRRSMTAAPGITCIDSAPHRLLAQAARDVVEGERARLPVLSHAVVLFPDLHATPDIARALRDATGLSALLLPRITTLEHWASAIPGDKPVASRAAREALLYQQLVSRAWLASADLWAVAGELAGLFDEMTRYNLMLPEDFAAFNRQLERAYRARSSASLTFETRLVHELWRVLARLTDEVDPASAYQLGLARIAESATAPLYAIGLERLAPGEQRFLERYAERVPVHVFSADREARDD